ncbi:RNA deprotection pyrophosphohydrolase [Litchfieldia salsa]|uniref:8-oxo-dGTPase n=1 Tax=Litchfieldia salsa TaxID=930152 RepID=A0A1H0QEA9_9BACI|nr:nucleoside triphosphatase YtkD [Litchfieldia salsa]SDP15677.1 8-oxo-dGTPase [Litchfieldia salsa]
MFVFQDSYQNEVHLSFTNDPFCLNPKHVWVICRYKDQWLLTKHKERGLEFPGGKVELGEKAKDAAVREVMEETGAEVKELIYLGQYKVLGRGKTIVKNIYFAEICSLTNQTSYFETYGPILMQDLPESIKTNNEYSFIMKDDVLVHSIKQVEQLLCERE